MKNKFFFTVIIIYQLFFSTLLNSAENLKIESSKFEIVDDFYIDNLDSYESFLSENGIGIAGIEIIFDAAGRHWTYDVNTNTNYNALAEFKAGVSAYDEIAKFLFRLTKQPRHKFDN